MGQVVKRRTTAEWEEIVSAFKESGQTQIAFSEQHGLSAKTLGAHIRDSEAGIREKSGSRSAEEWINLIEQQQASGMGPAAWCRKKGINADAMRTAKRRLLEQRDGRGAPSVSWMGFEAGTTKDQPATKEQETAKGVRVQVRGFAVEADAGYPVEDLAVLLRGLARV
jgi:hypothetical protein